MQDKLDRIRPEVCLLTSQEVCQVLRISRRTLYRWIQHRLLKPRRFGKRLLRFHPDDVLDAREWFGR